MPSHRFVLLLKNYTYSDFLVPMHFDAPSTWLYSSTFVNYTYSGFLVPMHLPMLLELSFLESVEASLIWIIVVCVFHIIKILNSFHSPEVEPQYAGPRIDGEEITLDFVKAMLDEFKKQKCIHKRYIHIMGTGNSLHVSCSLYHFS